MYLQTPSVSRYNLGPSNFSTPANFIGTFPTEQQHTKLVTTSIPRSGLCISTKRVSKALSIRKRRGGFVAVRCEGKDDGFYIRRCVEIARKGIGCTSPNPMVGCVIVKDGKIVGEGFHPKAGQPHAEEKRDICLVMASIVRCEGKDDGVYIRRCVEISRHGIGCTSPNPMVGCVFVKDGKIAAEVFALRDAGDLAENATAYVSLEPCNHYGKTPPCTEALIKAKVKKVVVGMVDPNPIVASKGVNRLRDAGIDVTVGVEEELCNKLIEAWIHQILTGKPFVALRYSLSIDGHFSDQLGEEATKSGGYYSQLLQEYDAVILSSTLLRENFSLPVSEEPGANQPLQIIIARNPSSPIQVPVLTTEASSKVVIFTDKETTVEPETAQKGIETVVLDGMNLITILDYCKRRGLCSVLLDIRGNIGDFEEMLREGFDGNLLQKVVVEMVPIWKGSKEERFPVAFTSLGQRLRLRNLSSRNSCRSVLLEGYF